MADIDVTTDLENLYYGRHGRTLVWVDKDIVYAFYINSLNRLIYVKSIDGGDSWSGVTTVSTDAVRYIDVWFDKWTPGNTGTKIHMFWLESTADDVRYRTLDVSDDTLGTPRTVYLGVTFNTSFLRNQKALSGVVAGNGDLYVQFWGDDNGERGFYRSQDGGVTWFGRRDAADGDVPDVMILLPAGSTGGNCIMIYWDDSENKLNLKRYFTSANTWNTTLISTGMVGSLAPLQLSAMIRFADNHIIVVAWSTLDAPDADLRVWDIETNIPTITAKTDVITNKSEVVCCSLLINQNNNDLYVAYLGNEDGSQEYSVALTAFFKKSVDGGDTWGSQQTYQEGAAADLKLIDSGPSTPGVLEGRFAPVIMDADDNDLFINKVNSVELLEIAGIPGGKSSVGRGVERGVLRGAI